MAVPSDAVVSVASLEVSEFASDFDAYTPNLAPRRSRPRSSDLYRATAPSLTLFAKLTVTVLPAVTVTVLDASVLYFPDCAVVSFSVTVYVPGCRPVHVILPFESVVPSFVYVPSVLASVNLKPDLAPSSLVFVSWQEPVGTVTEIWDFTGSDIAP